MGLGGEVFLGVGLLETHNRWLSLLATDTPVTVLSSCQRALMFRPQTDQRHHHGMVWTSTVRLLRHWETLGDTGRLLDATGFHSTA